MIGEAIKALAVQLYNDALDAVAPTVRDAADVMEGGAYAAWVWASDRIDRSAERRSVVVLDGDKLRAAIAAENARRVAAEDAKGVR